jgi:alpha-galactosidase
MNILDFADTFNPIELWLVDIDAYSLRLTDTIIKYMVKLHKKDIEVHSTTDRRKALPNADYILISISVGIQESEWFDIHIPLKFGIPQNTGDTVGPGGIFRGLRTIPSMVDMIRDIAELCPSAIVLNYTNPQGTLMLGILQAEPRVQSIGLCHELFYIASKKFARFLKDCGLDSSTNKKFEIIYGGLNHFAWITKFEYDGKDIYPMIREKAEYAYKTKKYGRPYNYYLLKRHGFLNYVEDRHITEFLPHYYNYFNHWEKPFGITELRDVQHINLERKVVYTLFRLGQKSTNRWIIKLFIRPMEGGEKALMMVKDMEREIHRHHVCNVLNNGAIPSLPDNCVVEIPAYFKDGKICPAKIGSLPNPINEMVKIQAENQQLVVNAALSGDSEDILKALLADPMCQFIEDNDKIEDMMWNLLFYERKWLPNFAESIPSYEEILKRKYHVKKKELLLRKNARKEKYAPDESLKTKAWPNVP